MLKNKKAIAIISVLLIIFLLYNIFFTNNNILALFVKNMLYNKNIINNIFVI